MVKTVWLHKVKDYNAWKKVFDSFLDTRKKSGERAFSVGTVQGEPNNVYVINDWESLDHFNKFRNNPDLINAMKEGGVLEEPKITILSESNKG